MDKTKKHNELHTENTFQFDHIKVDLPNLVFVFKCLPMFECYMVGCKSKNIYQKYTC